jgi:hypothetical protein
MYKTFLKDSLTLIICRELILHLNNKSSEECIIRKENSFSDRKLTELLSTATIISPSTILPAKPLVVGNSPAFAARLPPGTYSSIWLAWEIINDRGSTIR